MFITACLSSVNLLQTFNSHVVYLFKLQNAVMETYLMEIKGGWIVIVIPNCKVFCYEVTIFIKRYTFTI